MIKNVIFDFDGVIHDTFEFHLKNINQTFDINLIPEEYRHMHDGNFFNNSVSKTKDLDWNVYVNAIKDKEGSLVIETHVKEYIRNLAERFDLFLVTSGGCAAVKPYLVNNGVHDFFVRSLYKEDSFTKKEKFEHLRDNHGVVIAQSVFITDTLGDVLEANEINLKTIAVTFGFHDRKRLEKAHPYAIVDTWNEVIQTIDSMA